MIRIHSFRPAAVLALGAMAAAVVPARAPEPAPEAGTAIQAEIRALNASIREIAGLLREHLRQQRGEIALRRVELKSRSLVAAEQALHSARSEKSGLEGELAQIAAHAEPLQDAIDEQSRRGVDRADSPERAARADLDRRGKFLRERVEDVEGRILELENDLAARRREIAEMEEAVDAILEPR